MKPSGVDPVTLEGVYAVSENVVAREIEGEIVIVPLVAGIGDADDELYTLNDTGAAVWRRLDGTRTLGEVVTEVCEQFAVTRAEAERDIFGLVDELVRRGILVPAPAT